MFEGDRRRKVLTLTASCFALFMSMLDNTALNVALPTLSRELGAGVSGLQWIVDSYVLAFGTLLLTGGILGDRFGRRRVFLTGLAIFTLASLGCGLSSTTGQLIAGRSLKGVGAALLMPGTLSILTVTFPPSERAKAFGLWSGISGVALALGPTLGGWLIEHVGWQSIFFLNLPIGAVAFVLASAVVRESRSEQMRHLDLPGLGLGTAALALATYGLIASGDRGWSDGAVVASLGGSAVLLAAFLAWERSSPKAMLPLRLFSIPAFSAGNTVAFAVSFGMFGVYFFVTLFMQLVRGYSPFEAGLRFVPMTGMIFFVAPNAGRFAQRYGSRIPMTVGPFLAASGLLWMSRIGADTPYAWMLPGLMIMGIGMGSTMAPMTAAVMNAVGPMRAGLGGSMTNTSREVGGLFGVALLGTLLATRIRTAVSDVVASAPIVEAAGRGQLGPDVLAGLTPVQADAVRAAFLSGFLDGFQLAQVVAAAILLFAGLVSWRFIPSGAHRRDAEPEPVAA